MDRASIIIMRGVVIFLIVVIIFDLFQETAVNDCLLPGNCLAIKLFPQKPLEIVSKREIR